MAMDDGAQEGKWKPSLCDITKCFKDFSVRRQKTCHYAEILHAMSYYSLQTSSLILHIIILVSYVTLCSAWLCQEHLKNVGVVHF